MRVCGRGGGRERERDRERDRETEREGERQTDRQKLELENFVLQAIQCSLGLVKYLSNK